jgi:hypothetical protein
MITAPCGRLLALGEEEAQKMEQEKAAPNLLKYKYCRAIVRREAREGGAGSWLLRRREPPLVAVLCSYSAIEDDRMKSQMQRRRSKKARVTCSHIAPSSAFSAQRTRILN